MYVEPCLVCTTCDKCRFNVRQRNAHALHNKRSPERTKKNSDEGLKYIPVAFSSLSPQAAAAAAAAAAGKEEEEKAGEIKERFSNTLTPTSFICQILVRRGTKGGGGGGGRERRGQEGTNNDFQRAVRDYSTSEIENLLLILLSSNFQEIPAEREKEQEDKGQKDLENKVNCKDIVNE